MTPRYMGVPVLGRARSSYIGKAINLKARLSSHAQNAKLDAKEAAIVAGYDQIHALDTEFKALMLESS